jgi:hypothetical protein
MPFHGFQQAYAHYDRAQGQQKLEAVIVGYFPDGSRLEGELLRLSAKATQALNEFSAINLLQAGRTVAVLVAEGTHATVEGRCVDVELSDPLGSDNWLQVSRGTTQARNLLGKNGHSLQPVVLRIGLDARVDGRCHKCSRRFNSLAHQIGIHRQSGRQRSCQRRD